MRNFIRSALVSACLALSASPSFATLPLTDSQGQQLPTLAPMLKQVNPAVVNISVVATQTVQNPLLNDPFFRRFFNVPPNAPTEQKRRTQSAGSGVIVDAAKGIVVSNHHVVKGADEITVGLSDGRSLKAKLVGSDEGADVAVLQIEAKGLTALPLADSDKVEVGDFVVAIGNPFGLGQTVTSGVVSALGRSGLGIEGYEDFIQTDASINPGNSGGALVNLKGELVGINTAILAPSGGNVGIGFAIPTNMMKSSLEQILEHGEVQRGQLGVIIQDLTPELAEALEIKDVQRGVLIAQVQEGSNAAKAGLKPGDVVTRIDGKAVNTGAQLRANVGSRKIGEDVSLDLIREGKEKSISLKIGKAEHKGGESQVKLLAGTRLHDSPDGEGVVIADLQPDSPAAQSGLQAGDLIVGANRNRVHNMSELQAAARGANRLLLQIVRDGSTFFAVIR